METINMSPFDKAFEKNCQIRPCSYDPKDNFEPVTDEYGPRNILQLPYKLLWFHTYCAEKGIAGYVEADDYSIQVFEAVGVGMVTARAKVIMDDKIVATASAGKSFNLNDKNSMDGAVQAAAGSALSRALGNAGFGAISTNELTGSPAPVGIPQDAPLPFTMPAAPTAPQAPEAPAPSDVQQSFLPSEPEVDPVAAAKMMVCPCGPKKGMRYGEVLATAPAQIIWIAENWKQQGPALDAAKLLYDEAKKKCGK